MKNLHALVIFGFVLGLVSPALATNGTAVYFTIYYPNACHDKLPIGTKFVSLSDQYWDGGVRCGKRYNVTCTGPRKQDSTPCTGESVVVRTIDHCVDCEQSIVLSKEAFTIIADPEAGTIYVNFTLLD